MFGILSIAAIFAYLPVGSRGWLSRPGFIPIPTCQSRVCLVPSLPDTTLVMNNGDAILQNWNFLDWPSIDESILWNVIRGYHRIIRIQPFIVIQSNSIYVDNIIGNTTTWWQLADYSHSHYSHVDPASVFCEKKTKIKKFNANMWYVHITSE